MVSKRILKNPNPTIATSFALRRRSKFFLRHGARHEAEAEAMAKAELLEKSVRQMTRLQKKPGDCHEF